MIEKPTIIADAEVERRIQDAAMVLLDLCGAQIPPITDTSNRVAASAHMAGCVSLAVQAIFLNEKLRPDMTIKERMEGKQTITGAELMSRAYGLGVGVGHALYCIDNDFGILRVLDAYSSGLAEGIKDRNETMRRGGFRK